MKRFAALSIVIMLWCLTASLFAGSQSDTDHNCRFWGLISENSTTTVFQDQLINDPQSLENLSSINPDGWGIGYYPDGSSTPTILRGAPTAISDPQYDIAVNQAGVATPRITVAHIRNSSSGLIPSTGDPHPFERIKNGKNWLFGHNGTIDKDVILALIRPDYFAANPPQYGTSISEWIDSDLYQIYLMQTLEDFNWNVKPALGYAIRTLIDEIPGTGERMNFFLTDGTTLWGYRMGNTLWYMYEGTGNAYSVLASEPPTSSGAGWTELTDGDMITLYQDRPPVVERIEDFAGGVLLSENFFDEASTDEVLRANGTGQDWYESRNDDPTLLTLSTGDVGGNASNKALLTATGTTNAYLSQEFSTPQTSTFIVQWDIYIDEILDTDAPDRGGIMLIGDDTVVDNGPNANNDERFVYMAFLADGGGTTGTMDLVARDRDDGWTAFSTIATGLNMDQWYTIRVSCDLIADTYEVFVDGVYQATVSSRMEKTEVTHISFATWDDGPGTFYVDNVYQAMDVPLQTLSIAADPPGVGLLVPSEGDHSFAEGEVVTVSAFDSPGYEFDHWTGNVADVNSATTTIAMDIDESITAHYNIVPVEFLVDNDFNTSVDDTDLQTNGGGQDWYESRGAEVEQLTLNTDNIAGNVGAKALLTATGTSNTYLTQEFGAPQTGLFAVQWDIYVDEIIDTDAPDRGGVMLIGDDTVAGSGPNANNDERFVYMAFLADGGGTTGTMNLVARDRDDDWTAFSTVATGLNMDQWYTVKVICDLDADTYDVYVDDVFQATVSSRMEKTEVSHISFAAWDDGPGTFFVDNVIEVTEDMFSLTMAVDPFGAGNTDPSVGTRNYLSGADVTVTASTNAGYRFDHWTGDVADPSAISTTVTMDADKTATAFFIEQYALNVVVDGNGGVATDPTGGYFDIGTIVELTASPDPGWEFNGWMGDYVGSDNPLSLTITADVNITAVFLSTMPLFESEPVTSVSTGQAYYYDVNASGVPEITYSLLASPTGMNIDAISGEINWMTSVSGSFDVSVQAQNPNGTATQEFTIFVSYGPGLGSLELTSTSGHNLTTDDLTCDFVLAGEATTAATSWNKNGSPLMALYLPFEGGESNTLNDYSGSAHPATFPDETLTWNPSGGVSGSGAFTFGSHNYLSAGSIFPTGSSYTKAAWVYRTANNYHYSHIMCGEVYGTGGHHLRVSLEGHLVAGHDARNDIVADPGTFEMNQWYFVAVTYDYATGEMALYKNGVQVDAETVSAEEREVTDAILKIGTIWIAWQWEGQIDDVRLYNHSLTPEQISALYTSGQTIVAEETVEGDTWQAVVTPFSSTEAGESQSTEEVVIVGAITQSLTVNVEPASSGTTTPTIGTHAYPQNHIVTVTATPTAGYEFDSWEGNVADPGAASTTITMGVDEAIIAHFTLIPTYTLTMSADPIAGGTIVPVAGVHTYEENTEVIVTATASAGYGFDHWTGDVADPSLASTTIMMDDNQVVTAHFLQRTNVLTMAVNDAESGLTAPVTGSHTYPENEVVPVAAYPFAGYQFDNWTGDVADASSVNTSVEMDADQIVTANFSMIPAVFLADNGFTASLDTEDLRLNRGGQDWYESRADDASLLTLTSETIGGNIGAKAQFTGSTSGNVYLSQEFGVPQSGSFSVQWDIYVDEILNISNPDRTAFMLIGDNSIDGNGPSSTNDERFVYMAFARNGGGTTGTMELMARDRDDGWTSFSTISTGLNLDQWYKIRVDCNLDTDTYDIYVDDVFQATVTSRMAKGTVTHISFAQWNDGAGSFLIDNVEQFVQEPIITSITPTTAQPGETLSLTVTGQYLFFGTGSSTLATISSGLYNLDASSIAVISANELTAEFDIPADAPTGKYSLAINETGVGSLSADDCLIVATAVGGQWSLTMIAVGEDVDNASSTATVIFGIDESASVLDGPPNPIDYTVDFKLYQSDWSGPYVSDIKENTGVAYSWIIGLNPHGNVPPPLTDRCAELQWDPNQFVAGSNFQLIDRGIDGSENTVIIEDMSLQTSYEVCGADVMHYFEILYWSDNVCFEFELVSGWQLISLPIITIDNDIQSLFPDYQAAWKYDNSFGQYVTATTIEPCEGYWLKMPSSQTYTVCGNAVNDCDGSYADGWHLIGAPNCAGSPGSDPVDNILALWNYDASGAMYMSETIIEPYIGYWIKLQDAGDISLNCGGSTVAVGSETIVALKTAVENHSLTIGVQGQSLGGSESGEVIIGIEDIPRVYPAAPAPPEFSARILTYGSDWSGPYYEDMQVSGENDNYWIIAVNPHGNILPPAERTAAISWNPLDMGDVQYELREGTDGTGELLIEDMRQVNEYVISGIDQNYYFTVGISRKPTDVDDDAALPQEYSLKQCIPNPFNPSTEISFTIPERTEVILEVYNIIGQRVSTLYSGECEAGTHTVYWYGKDIDGQVLPSGVYLYRLQSADYSETRKMLLLK